ncbi:MAG: diguanylate cyclase [Pseudomonadales bacterium]|nr:diguanylate cyclase [Pseudomonadales bacterium]
MNRDLDYRSDFYSLGVLLFELLTQQQPFKSDNTLEWVHSHISREPPTPDEIAPHIPAPVSAIVLKLLAKNPEARYQSADGLLYDLAHCADLLALDRDIEPFELGQKDIVQKFLVPQEIYGRQAELQELLSLFEAAVNGSNEFCLVHGYSGVGKSALVNEIDRPLVREQGFLVQGKFEQFHKCEAYTAIATTFRGLVQQVLTEPEESLQQWRERLLANLAPNAGLVVDLVPELELIIGVQPEVAELPPAEARNRLQLVLTKFLRTYSEAGRPVVLFLDDLQWSDAPTLELLLRFVTSHELSHLLLIGAYRDNEVGAGHPLRLMLETIQHKKNIRQLPLGPLDRESVAQLVADALNCDPEGTRPLSNMIFEKAQGNPFFTNELLRQLHKEGAIFREPDSGQWLWDLNVARWASVSSDVVKFMVNNLRRLQPETQRVLQLAACIGSTFDLQTLGTIYERSITETAAALLPALKQHAVQPLHSDYRLVGRSVGANVNTSIETPTLNPTYRFQHDRVQQAAYALIDSEQLQHVHLSVGRLMLRHVGNTDAKNLAVPEERVIDIVGHLNKGRALITHTDEKGLLAELNLRAGIRTRQSSAYETAHNFLQVALELLPDNPWGDAPKLMASLAEENQLCAYLTGRTDLAEHWIEEMLSHAQTDLQRSNILATRTRQYATLGRMEESILAAIRGLALLGVAFTDNPSDEDIAKEKALVEHNLGNRNVADLVAAKIIDDPPILTAMRLLMEIFPAAFLSGSGNLFPYLVMKSVNLSLRHGNSPESAFAYAAYGMLLCGEPDAPATGFEYGKVALAINERLDDLALRARVIYVYAMFIHHWSNHWSSLTPWFRKGIEAGYQSGDLLYLAYSAQDCVIWDPSLDLETAYEQHARHLDIVSECAYQDSLDSGTLYLQLQRNLLGLTNSPCSLSDEGFDAEKCLMGMRERQFMTGIANYHIYHAEICLLYGAYDSALQHVRAQDELIKSAMSLPQLVRFYIVAFLTLATHYPNMKAQEKQKTLKRLQDDHARMQRWADNCPENFRHLQYLMEAELHRLAGRDGAALERFDVAIDTARESGFLRDEATACERAARHLLQRGWRRAAEGYLRGAHRVYDRWGACRKVEFLEQEFPVLRELVGQMKSVAGNAQFSDLDLASVMKASREISGEIVLDRLLNTTLEILLENAGGQWGCLLVRRNGLLSIEAALLPDMGLPSDNLPAHSMVSYSHDKNCEDKKLPLPVTLINQVFHDGEAVVLHDACREGSFTQDPYVRQLRPASVFCIPVRRERFEGALYIENNLASGVFTKERIEVIQLLAAQAAVAIENARLYEQVQDYSKTLEEKVAERTARLEQLNQELQGLADCDGLTGVANRRRGDTYLEEVWVRLRREQKPLSVIMLDVDHFKAYNDTYGHQAGDDCLVAVAKAVGKELHRPADLIARYGGEEFILILPDTDHAGVTIVGAKVREAVETLAVPHSQSSASKVVTISAGAATTVPGNDGTGMGQLLREADVALYQAKRLGRNQVQYSCETIEDSQLFYSED